MSRRPTQVDIAAAAGVERRTVNRILNGHHEGFSASTVERVQAVAEAAGYARPGSGSAVTMKDIARALGVSYVTVSKAFRGRLTSSTAKISDATRARVLAKADELGYTPPPFKARPR